MIGVFDSGLGGLTVVKEIFRVLPDAPILYLGDLARMPYGVKSAETIKHYAEEDARFLLSHGAKVIVVACNTASSLAFPYLWEKFSDVPILEVVSPAAERAIELSKNKRIAVIGTRATIASRVYEQKIGKLVPGAKIFSSAAPLLVPLIEEGWLDRRETKLVIHKYLYPLRRAGIDTLILGCTHFPLIKNIIQHKIGRRVKIVDSAEEAARVLARECQMSDVKYQKFGESRFFVTDFTPHWQSLAEKWLGRKIKLELVNL